MSPGSARDGRDATQTLWPLFTFAALLAFAANSILCRLALGERSIDAASFTALRLVSGALVLALLAGRRGVSADSGRAWKGALWLLIYALPFSFAYLELETGTGALLLFGTVQLTMVGLGIRAGERPTALEMLGIAGAAGGVAYLVSPGVSAPDPLGAASMILAGVGWGLYSFAGKSTDAPLRSNADNFARAALVVAPLAALAWPRLEITTRGALLAVASGAFASGVGYAIWYRALPHLSATRAALVQLAVPAIAAAGGIVFMGEVLTTRLAVAAAVITGSIALGISGKSRTRGGTAPPPAVVVLPYDPAWAATFETLRHRIEPALENVAVAIEHVGSTSVPGLAAKPIIDLDVVVADDDGVRAAIDALAGLGYTHRGNLGIEGREAFLAPEGSPPHHLYVCVEGCMALRNHLAVRDRLRSDPRALREYAEVKHNLAREFSDDIDGYIEGKSTFLRSILERELDRDELDAIEDANRRPQG